MRSVGAGGAPARFGEIWANFEERPGPAQATVEVGLEWEITEAQWTGCDHFWKDHFVEKVPRVFFVNARLFGAETPRTGDPERSVERGPVARGPRPPPST